MHVLLDALDSPQKKLKCIHVAGTKGKGSTVAFLESILKESGYRVGCYTSPHLQSICERIRIDGVDIKEEEFESLVQGLQDSVDACQEKLSRSHESLSHFEVLTGMAFRHFHESQVDVAIVEAGLGGARDATNVIENLDLAVITPIGMEHADALGGSLESISRAKAGIMKEGVPSVIAKQLSQEAEAVLLHEASMKKSKTYRTEAIVQYHLEPHDGRSRQQSALFKIPQEVSTVCFDYDGPDGMEFEVDMPLLGEHQASNAATAITSAIALKTESKYDAISLKSIQDGVQNTPILGGRFQIIQEMEVDGRPMLFVVDGAHTQDSAACLATTVRQVFPNSKIALVVSMASDKDHESFFCEIQKSKPFVVVFTDSLIAGGSTRSAGPGVLVGAWQVAKMKNTIPGWRCRELIQASIKSAIAKAKHELSGEDCTQEQPGVILVTGSLHAAGAAMVSLDHKSG